MTLRSLKVRDCQFKKSGFYPEGPREALKNVKWGNLHALLLIHLSMSVTFPIKGNVKVLSWISAWSEWKWESWPHNHILTSRRLNWIGEPLSCLPRRMKLNKVAWQRQSFDGLKSTDQLQCAVHFVWLHSQNLKSVKFTPCEFDVGFGIEGMFTFVYLKV